MASIRIAIVGVGNCASALVQGLGFYGRFPAAAGLMHRRIGGYAVDDIEVVSAFDIDRRKVGRKLSDAIFAAPNNTTVFCRKVPGSSVTVQMGPVLDGCPAHMGEFAPPERFEPARRSPVDVARALRRSGAQVLVNYLPVGSQRATEHYARACLQAGVALVNCVPVFIVSDTRWARRFTQRGLPCVGDDIKAQVGATITHRTLVRLLRERGMKLESTYQLNVGGNTDFLNMLARSRLASKKISKTQAVLSETGGTLEPGQIHVGPSDYVPFLKDNKVCFLRLQARGFGGVPMDLELRLSVEDSPNSAGVVVDAIRCCKLGLDRKLAGPLKPVCAYTMKHPPVQMPDHEARLALDAFAQS
jgi:myo-inositol-1-phosphate synthase